MDDTVVSGEGSSSAPRELLADKTTQNHLSRDLMKTLRKKNFPFPRFKQMYPRLRQKQEDKAAAHGLKAPPISKTSLDAAGATSTLEPPPLPDKSSGGAPDSTGAVGPTIAEAEAVASGSDLGDSGLKKSEPCLEEQSSKPLGSVVPAEKKKVWAGGRATPLIASGFTSLADPVLDEFCESAEKVTRVSLKTLFCLLV